jgi:hypothetical protein
MIDFDAKIHFFPKKPSQPAKKTAKKANDTKDYP